MNVNKRYQGERHYITEFVQPGTLCVTELSSMIAVMPGDFAKNALEWIRRNIKYPNGNVECVDWHYYEAFRVKEEGKVKVLAQKWATDFWQFPAETVSLSMGDCEDLSILLCSILRTRYVEDRVFVTVGYYNGMGHAWVTLDGIVFEPSPSEGEGIYKEEHPYSPVYKFNDILVRK